jgi:cephalosporin-C deacetylase
MIELPYEKPEDFEAFWHQATHEALHHPLKVVDWQFKTTRTATHEVDTFAFEGIDGTLKYGWLAYPEGARGTAAVLWLPPYGRESKLPDVYGTREGMVSLSFNFHGESPFHQEAYAIERGYFASGADEPETWVFRRMFQDAVIASRILQAQVQVDANRISVSGMSQGGGLSIWQGAWNPIIKRVCADMPFLSTIGNTLLNSVYRYPLKELKDFMDTIPVGEARVLHTLSYFDTAFQAEHCTIPTQVSLGLKDPACRPDTVRAAYQALRGERNLIEYDHGHDWHPDMVQNNLSWFNKQP